MTSLPRIATRIYLDDMISFDHGHRANLGQIEEIVEEVAPNAFDPMPDPAAPLVAARLLHSLVTIRRRSFFNPSPAWVLVETYLLLHGLKVSAQDEEIGALLESMRRGRVDASSTLRFISGAIEPVPA